MAGKIKKGYNLELMNIFINFATHKLDNMKRFLFALVCLFAAYTVHAQELYFTYWKTMEFKTNDGKDFVSFDVPGKTAAELCSYVKANFENIKQAKETGTADALNTEMTFNFLQRKVVDLRGQEWYADVNIKMLFKDGRFRVMAPEITKYYKPDPIFGNFRGPTQMMTQCKPEDVVHQLARRHVFNPTSDCYYDFNRSVNFLIIQLIALPTDDELW